MIRRLVRTALPLSRTGMALWAWRNRDSIQEWGRFAGRAVQDLASGGSPQDVMAEARLRASLSANRRTRGAAVDVEVREGVAIVRGRATPEVHAAVQDVLMNAKGIHRVRDEIVNVGLGGDRSRRRRPFSQK